MADVYEQNLEQKSTLTTSDFIRVVGSDNVSYKQGAESVASLVENINGSVIQLSTSVSKDEAIHNYVDGLPNTSTVYTRVFATTGGHRVCIIQKYTNNQYASVLEWDYWYGDKITIHKKQGGTWQVTTVPTQAEIDALNSKRAYVAWGTNLTFTVPTGRQALVFIGNAEIHLLWNPLDSLGQNLVFSAGGASARATITRGSSATQVVVQTASNNTLSALII